MNPFGAMQGDKTMFKRVLIKVPPCSTRQAAQALPRVFQVLALKLDGFKWSSNLLALELDGFKWSSSLYSSPGFVVRRMLHFVGVIRQFFPLKPLMG